MSVNLDDILDAYPDEEFLLADGFEDAIMGVCRTSYRIIYSASQAIEILQRDGMDYEEAVDYFEYNTIRSLPYMGAKAPIFMDDYFG